MPAALIPDGKNLLAFKIHSPAAADGNPQALTVETVSRWPCQSGSGTLSCCHDEAGTRWGIHAPCQTG
jgi:hypothetical protein